MEEKEQVKTENSMANSTFSDQIPASCAFSSSIFDMPCEVEKGSLGFMDLLGIQDYSPSLFDLLQPPLAPHPLTSPASSAPPESSEVVNAPATPNSSSISSSSTEAANDDQTKAAEEEEQDQEKNKQQWVPCLFLFPSFFFLSLLVCQDYYSNLGALHETCGEKATKQTRSKKEKKKKQIIIMDWEMGFPFCII